MIYCIELSPNTFKIGFSSDPQKRLKAFLPTCPDAEILRTWQGDQNLELDLHSYLRTHPLIVQRNLEVYQGPVLEVAAEWLTTVAQSGRGESAEVTALKLQLVGESEQRHRAEAALVQARAAFEAEWIEEMATYAKGTMVFCLARLYGLARHGRHANSYDRSPSSIEIEIVDLLWSLLQHEQHDSLRILRHLLEDALPPEKPE